MKKVWCVFIVILAIIFSADIVSAAVVSPGSDPHAVITNLNGEVRYRHFSSTPADRGIYIGKQDVGDAANRIQEYCSWVLSPSSNHVTFTYNQAAGTETTVVQGSITVSYGIGNQGPLNYMEIHVVNRGTGTPSPTVDFNNVTLNGAPLCGPPCNFSAAAGEGWKTWMVTGVDLTAGFTIEGDIVLSGSQPDRELNKVEISAGHLGNVRDLIPPDVNITYFPFIQIAYDSCPTNYTIQSQRVTYDENLLFDDNISVTLEGGYDPGFTSNLGYYSTINGSMTISNGTVVVENIIIQ